jgi:hypothetical protein
MARAPDGGYALAANNPIVAGTTIESSWANATMNDMRIAMEDSLSRSGKGSMTAQFKGTPGSASSPGIAFSTAVTSGLYYSSPTVGISVGGASKLELISNQITAREPIWVGTTAKEARLYLNSPAGFNSAVRLHEGGILKATFVYGVGGDHATMSCATTSTVAAYFRSYGTGRADVYATNGQNVNIISESGAAILKSRAGNVNITAVDGEVNVYGDTLDLDAVVGNISMHSVADVNISSGTRIALTAPNQVKVNAGYFVTDTLTRVQLQRTTDVNLTDTDCALITGSPSGTHIEYDNNEIQAKSNATTASTLNFNVLGGAVTMGASGEGNIALRGTDITLTSSDDILMNASDDIRLDPADDIILSPSGGCYYGTKDVTRDLVARVDTTNRHGAGAYRTTNKNYGSNQNIILEWNAERGDANGVLTAADRFQPAQAGYYGVRVDLVVGSHNGQGTLKIFINGAVNYETSLLYINHYFYLDVNDYADVRFSSGDSNWTMTTASTVYWFQLISFGA